MTFLNLKNSHPVLLPVEQNSDRTYLYFLDLFFGWLAVAIAFFLPLSTSITDALFIVCTVLFFLRGQYLESFRLIWHRRALFACVLLFAWIWLGVAYTVAPWQDAWHGLIKYDKLLLGIFLIPVFTQEKWRRYALHAFFLAVIVTLAIAVFKDIGLLNRGEKYGRFLVFKDHIQTSFLLAMAAYFSLVLFFEQSARSARWVYGALFILCVFFLFSVNGRSGYLVFFMLLTWLLWSRWRWYGIMCAILMAFLITTVAYFFSPGFNSRLQESVHDMQAYKMGEDNTPLGLRAEFVHNSIQLIKQYPVLGAGTGSFTSRYTNLDVPVYLKTHNPHNQYIHVLVQWGVVGFLLLLWMFYTQWRDSWLLLSPARQIAQGVVLAIMIGSIANSWLLDTTEGHFYIYFIVLAFASQIRVKK